MSAWKWRLARALAGATLCSVALFACDEGGELLPGYTQAPSSGETTLTLGANVVYIDPWRERVQLLPVGGKDPQPATKTVELPGVPRSWEPRNRVQELLFVISGDRQDDEVQPSLSVLDTKGKLRNYQFDGHIGQLAQSEDGRWAVLFAGTDDMGHLVTNLNQIAIVDLAAPPSDENPRTHTLLGLGSAPHQAEVTASFNIVGEQRQLAVLYSETYISLFDLSHPERSEITVPLGATQGDGSARPAQVLFDESRSALFVRTSNSADVYMVNVSEDVDDVSEHDFVLAPPNPLSVGGIAEDIQIYEESDGSTRLLALLPESLRIVEPNSARMSSIEFPGRYSRMVAFTLEDDTADGPGRLLLYGLTQEVSHLAFVQLQDLEKRRSRNVDVLSVPAAPFVFVEVAILGERAVLQDQNGGTTLTVVDLRTHGVFPLIVASRMTIDREREQLWVTGDERVAVVRLDDLSVREFSLDSPIRAALLPEGSAYVVFDHADMDGYVTLMDREQPSRSNAISLRGFFWQDLLARGEQ